MKKHIKKFIDFVKYPLLVLVLVWLVPLILSSLLKTKHPLAVVTSNSMWPVLKSGDLVLIKGAEPEVLGVSDIAVYENENGFTIHRVIDKGQQVFVAKGDANTGQGEQVYYDQLEGKAVMIGEKPVKIPYLGYVGSLLRNFVENI